MSEHASRFAHFLQPIRDLSKIWKIEIAEELETYLAELSQITIDHPEDGVTSLNFAEAALLIQGSTAVYSRKVELLYNLVYQALDLIAGYKDGRMKGPKGKYVQTGLWSPIPDTDELLTIDHLIKEGRGICMTDPVGPRDVSQRRVPLFLMPRDQADRRRREFRISACHVHRTGALLIQESDAQLLDNLLATNKPDAIMGDVENPLAPAPPQEVHDLDSRLRELLQGMQEPPQDEPGAEERPPVVDTRLSRSPAPGQNALGATPQPGSTPLPLATPGTGGALSAGLPSAAAAAAVAAAAPDPWALLDEHDITGKDAPMDVGKCGKRISQANLILGGIESLPDLHACEPLPDEELWKGGAAAAAAPMLAGGHPVEALFLTVAGHLRPVGRYEAQRAGFSAAWLEMEDLFVANVSKRRAAKMKRRQQQRAAAGEDGGAEDPAVMGDGAYVIADEMDAEAEAVAEADALAEAEDLGAPMTPLKDCDEGPGDATPDRTPRKNEEQLSEEKLRYQEQRKEAAELENMIEDAQRAYEMTVRHHLNKMHLDQFDAESKTMPDLYANVRRWQEQLEPVLKEYGDRSEFDVYEYSHKLLGLMDDTLKARGQNKKEGVVSFKDLVSGQPRWEICRRFLTCLLLTNSGNTDIVYGSDAERLNMFSLKLLSSNKKMISLEALEEEAENQRPPSQKKKAARLEKGGEAPDTSKKMQEATSKKMQEAPTTSKKMQAAEAEKAGLQASQPKRAKKGLRV